MVLPNMCEQDMCCLENKIKKYVWQGKRPKITNNLLYQQKENGGLKLSNMLQ